MGDYHLTARCAVLEGVAQEVLQRLKGTDAEYVAVRGEDVWGYGYPPQVRVVDAPEDHRDFRQGYIWEYVSREDYLHELSCEMDMLINDSPDWHDDWQGDRRA
jgi:hypothetical protein